MKLHFLKSINSFKLCRLKFKFRLWLTRVSCQPVNSQSQAMRKISTKMLAVIRWQQQLSVLIAEELIGDTFPTNSFMADPQLPLPFTSHNFIFQTIGKCHLRCLLLTQSQSGPWHFSSQSRRHQMKLLVPWYRCYTGAKETFLDMFTVVRNDGKFLSGMRNFVQGCRIKKIFFRAHPTHSH